MHQPFRKPDGKSAKPAFRRKPDGPRPAQPDADRSAPSAARKGELRFTCPVAAQCGGCQLQRMSYPEQLRFKQQKIEELLSGLCPVEPILGMENPFHYRSKVHAVLSVDKKGVTFSGVYALGTHRVIAVKH